LYEGALSELVESNMWFGEEPKQKQEVGVLAGAKEHLVYVLVI